MKWFSLVSMTLPFQLPILSLMLSPSTRCFWCKPLTSPIWEVLCRAMQSYKKNYEIGLAKQTKLLVTYVRGCAITGMSLSGSKAKSTEWWYCRHFFMKLKAGLYTGQRSKSYMPTWWDSWETLRILNGMTR